MIAQKFKAWSHTKNQMADVSALYYTIGGQLASADLVFTDHKSLCTADTFDLLPSVGHRDKAGKDVYYHDVVKCFLLNELGSYSPAVRVIGYCKNAKAFELTLVDEDIGEHYAIMDVEVLGNVYQHKHLIK